MTEETAKQKIATLRQAHPAMPPVELARKISITRERARQILNELSLPTRFPLPQRYCSSCRAPIYRYSTTGLCKSCQYRSHHVVLTCEQCGHEYGVLRAVHNAQLKRGYKHNFCSRRCFGKWLALHYGFGPYPDHMYARRSRVDHSEVCRLRKLGYTIRGICVVLSCSEPTAWHVLYRNKVREGRFRKMASIEETKCLINFWESSLSQYSLVMSPSAIYQVEQTIKALQQVVTAKEAGAWPRKLFSEKVSEPSTPD